MDLGSKSFGDFTKAIVSWTYFDFVRWALSTDSDTRCFVAKIKTKLYDAPYGHYHNSPPILTRFSWSSPLPIRSNLILSVGSMIFMSHKLDFFRDFSWMNLTAANREILNWMKMNLLIFGVNSGNWFWHFLKFWWKIAFFDRVLSFQEVLFYTFMEQVNQLFFTTF